MVPMPPMSTNPCERSAPVMTLLVLVAVATPLVVEASAELPMVVVPETVASLATVSLASMPRPSARSREARELAAPTTLEASEEEVRLERPESVPMPPTVRLVSCEPRDSPTSEVELASPSVVDAEALEVASTMPWRVASEATLICDASRP